MSDEHSDQDGRMTNEQTDRPIPQYDRSTNEQDRFLDYCQRNQIPITVYLESGRPLQGKILEHDRKCILLGATRQEKIPKLIPKSYIAVVRAEEVLPLFLEYKGRGNYITRKKARKAKQKAEKVSRSSPAQSRAVRQKKKPSPPSTSWGSSPSEGAPRVLVKKKPRVSRPTSQNSPSSSSEP